MIFGFSSRSHKVTGNESGRLKRSAEILKVNTLTSHDLKHEARRFEYSTLISLVNLDSTESEMIRT
jgi:hypothetical protein